MDYMEAMASRRSRYALTKTLPLPLADAEALIRRAAELTPDAFNMRSARAVIVSGEKQDALWDGIYAVFGGKVPREKIDGFRAACGTVLYFIDTDVVRAMQARVPRYAENFPVWAQQAGGMLQYSVWTALSAAGIGANLQHYNPVIDDMVRTFCGTPPSWQLTAQMPFGGIAAPAADKESETVSDRVWTLR